MSEHLGDDGVSPGGPYRAVPSEFEGLNELMTNFSNAIVIQVAMDEELTPLLAVTVEAQRPFTEGAAIFYPRTLQVADETVPLLLVRSKIGLVNASSATTEALNYSSNCLGVISSGSAGGLPAVMNVGDMVLGTDYTYTDADASAFGYARGQIPGMPATYQGRDIDWDEAVNHAVEALAAAQQLGAWKVHQGRMLSGNSFVTAHNVRDTRDAFPTALSTDMETTAIAQVCANYDVPFIAVRCISDLCGPAADHDFHLSIDVVAPRAARYALQVAAELWTQRQLPELELGLP